jgi:peroxiredoxin
MTSKFHRLRLLAWIAGMLVAIVAPFAIAAADEDLGPPVGTKAPDIGTRPDQTGKPRVFSDLTGKNGLVFMFFRSADWCPFCKAQLIAMNGGVDEIEKRGYHLAGLSYDTPEILATFIAKWHIRYTLLSDPKSEVIDGYKLRDPQYPPGNRAYGVPRPIIFFFDPNAVIKAKLYEESFKDRPPVSEVISTLDRLGGRS